MSRVSQEDDRSAERLAAAVAAARVPDAVVRAWTAEPPEPAPGQLWRARWGDVVELVLLFAVASDTVQVAPASVDVECADDGAVVVAESDTSLGIPVAVWDVLARELPMRVLDRHAGHLAPDLATPAGVAEAALQGRAQRGRSAFSPLDPCLQFRSHLDDALDTFRAARWAPTGTGSLAVVLRGAGVEVTQLMDLLEVPAQRALALLRGRAAVTEEEAERLQPVTGLTVADLLAANPALPAGLVACLDRPIWRARVQRLAVRSRMPEPVAWQAAGYGTWALAARQTGGEPSAAWGERLGRYFAVVLGE
jgi:hypothetical protein